MWANHENLCHSLTNAGSRVRNGGVESLLCLDIYSTRSLARVRGACNLFIFDDTRNELLMAQGADGSKHDIFAILLSAVSVARVPNIRHSL
jgi:hypothetical protein